MMLVRHEKLRVVLTVFKFVQNSERRTGFKCIVSLIRKVFPISPMDYFY